MKGDVRAIAVIGTRAIVGGSFSKVAKGTGSLAVTDKLTGATVGTWPNIAGEVSKILPDGSGGYYVAGDIRAVNGAVRYGVVRLDSSLVVVPGFNIDVQLTYVRDILKVGSWLYVAGAYQYPINTNRYLGRFDAVTGARDTSWTPNIATWVYALEEDGSNLYIGGSFIQAESQPRQGLAAYDLATGAIRPWTFAVPSPQVRVLRRDGTRLYIGGSFSAVAGLPRTNTAAIDLVGNSILPWSPKAGVSAQAVNDILITPSHVYLAGNFTSVSGQSRSMIAQVDKNLGIPTSFVQNQLNAHDVKSISTDGTHIYAVVMQSDYAWRFDATTGLVDGSWLPGLWNSGNVILAEAGRVLMGGQFGALGGQDRNSLFAFDLGANVLDPWQPSCNGAVECLLHSGSTLYAGGSFTDIAGSPRQRLAAFDGATLAQTAFAPMVSGTVHALADYGGELIATGYFEGVGPASSRLFARIDKGTGNATPLTTGVSGVGYAAAVWNDTLFVGGMVSQGLTGSVQLVAWDLASNSNLSPPSILNNTVRALTPFDGDVLVGGLFNLAGGASREGGAIIDASTLALNPGEVAGPGTYALVRDGNKVYIGGTFSSALGVGSRSLLRISYPARTVDAWYPSIAGYGTGMGGFVKAIGIGASKVVVGGDFYGSALGASPNLIVLPQ